MVIKPAITIIELVDGWGAAYSLVFGLGTVFFFGAELLAIRAQRVRHFVIEILIIIYHLNTTWLVDMISPAAALLIDSLLPHWHRTDHIPLEVRQAQAGGAVRSVVGPSEADHLVRTHGDATTLLLVR